MVHMGQQLQQFFPEVIMAFHFVLDGAVLDTNVSPLAQD